MIYRLWLRVNEPRTVSVLVFFQYVALLVGGVSLFKHSNPTVSLLAAILAGGGLVGAFAALPGVYWLERFAVGMVSLAVGLFLVVLFTYPIPPRSLEFWSLQVCMSVAVLIQQAIRWVRIRTRPYRPL